MKILLCIAVATLAAPIVYFFSKPKLKKPSGSAYNYTFTSLLTSKPLPLSQFRGNVILVVNTASNCGFTNQYKGLEELYSLYKDQGLVVIGIPSNDFGQQEPGTSKTIAEFCQLNYGVSFPMALKEVVSGEKAHPFYKWAQKVLGSEPKWNFHKYLIDRNGKLVYDFNSLTQPTSQRIIKCVKKLLAAK